MKLLFLSSFLLGILASSLSNAAKPPKIPPKEGNEGEFFWRPATKDIVKLMKNTLNESANPCDDFWSFSCGNYGKKSSYAPYEEIMNSLLDEIQRFLINRMSNITDSKAVNATNKLMQTCLNTNRSISMHEIYTQLDELFAEKSLDEIFNYMAYYGIQTSFYTNVDLQDNITKLALKPATDAFHQNIVYLAAMRPFIEQTIQNKELVEEVMGYATKLFDVGQSKKEIPTPKKYFINYNGILNFTSEELYKNGKTFFDVPFVNRLDKLISETKPEVVRAHTLMKAAFSLAIVSTDGLKELPREEACVAFIQRHLTPVVMTMVAKEMIPVELRDGAHEVFSNVLDALTKTLDKQEWLGQSRKKAIKKAKEVKIWLGVPPYLENYTNLDSVYEGFEVKSDEFLTQYLDLLVYKQSMVVALVDKPIKEALLHIYQYKLIDINAFNAVALDLTVFTTAILQSPMFYYRFPDFYRYGLLGFIFGHEYGHGLAKKTSPGAYFSPAGEISQSTKEAFSKRAQCVVDQFNSDFDNTTSNYGARYVNENIADMTGLQMAFKAYKKEMKRTRRPKLLREFDEYNSDQLFFISMAQFFCPTTPQGMLKGVESGDPHAPNQLRVYSVRNSDEFAKAFECPVGSNMNPRKKCRLWD